MDVVEVDSPTKVSSSNNKVNLSNYINGYTGTTKALRLRFIASKFNDRLQQEATNLLAHELKNGLNLEMLLELNQTTQLNPNDSYDEEWAGRVRIERRRGIAQAESNLSHAKSSSNKESIRRGHMELGDLYIEHGDLPEAIKCYQRSRDYLGKSEHAIETYSKIAICHIDCKQYGMAEYALMKIDGINLQSSSLTLKSHTLIIQGLLSLLNGKYLRCAKDLLDIDGNSLVNTSLEHTITNIMTISDIGVYCCLCALATFDVADIKYKILDNKTFKPILESTLSNPATSGIQGYNIRLLMEYFIDSNYSEFLKLLSILKNNLLLIDMHMDKHIDKLLEIISDRAIVQYCLPYSSLDLKRMALSLNQDVNELEKNIARLIGKGDLSFRIDSAKHELHSKIHNIRDTTFEKVSQLNEMHASSIKQGVLRLSLLRHNFSVMPENEKSRTKLVSSTSISDHDGADTKDAAAMIGIESTGEYVPLSDDD